MNAQNTIAIRARGRRLAGLCGLVLLAGSCAGPEPPPAALETVNTDTLPNSEFFGPTELALTEGVQARWRLLTSHIVRFDAQKKVVMDPVTVYIYTEGRKDSNILTADTGETTDDLSRLIARGNVVVRTSDGKCLKTEEIYWEKNTEQISSPALVRLTTREGDVISGVGFEADNSMNRWKIKNRVKAKIQQVDKKADQIE